MSGKFHNRVRTLRPSRTVDETDDYQERVTDFYSPTNTKSIDRNSNSANLRLVSGGEQARNQRVRGLTTPVGVTRPVNASLNSDYRQSGMTKSTYVTNAASVSVGIASVITETILVHPLIVLRRQCQVTNSPKGYHLGPLSILPITFKLVRNQGFMSLTKGMGTSFVLRGSSTVLETALAELLNLPREVTRYSSAKQYFQFLTLKVLSSAILLPFYAAHLTECVQSDVLGERMTLLDFFRDGLDRTLNLITFGARPISMRVFPLWKVIVPASVLFASQFIVRTFVQHLVQTILTQRLDEAVDAQTVAYIPESPIEIHQSSELTFGRQMNNEAASINEGEEDQTSSFDEETDVTLSSVSSRQQVNPTGPWQRRMHHSPKQHDALVYEHYYVELISAFIGALVADIQLYAAETVINRLCVQGTRTLIDDLSTGVSVVPVSFHYTGVLDAVHCIATHEGLAGFYRGFGALVLQYALHFAVVKVGRFAVERVVELYSPRPRRSTVAPLREGVQKYKLPPRRNRDDD